MDAYLPVAVKGFSMIFHIVHHHADLIESSVFAEIFAQEICRLAALHKPREEDVFSALVLLLKDARGSPLVGLIRGIFSVANARLLPVLMAHTERAVATQSQLSQQNKNKEEQEKVVEEDLDALVASILMYFSSVSHSVSSTVSAQLVRLARSFRSVPLIFPHSPAVSCAALKLATWSSRTPAEAEEEMTHLSRVLRAVVEAKNEPTPAMVKMFVFALDCVRFLSLNHPAAPRSSVPLTAPTLLETLMLKPHIPLSLDAHGGRSLLATAYCDIVSARVAQGDQGPVIRLIAKSPNNEHAIHVLAQLCKSPGIPLATLNLILPSLRDRLAETPGEHAQASICSSLVQVILAHPESDALKDGVSALRSTYVCRKFPAFVTESFETLARGLPFEPDQVYLKTLLNELVSMFLHLIQRPEDATVIDGAGRLVPAVRITLERLSTNADEFFGGEHSPILDASLRRRLAQMWVSCCLHLDKINNDAARELVRLAKVVPPLVFLGSDQIKLFGDKYLLAVEKLESYRARQGDFAPFVSYLLDGEIARHNYLAQVCTLGKSTLEIFLTQYLPPLHKASTEHQNRVQREALALLGAASAKASQATERRFCLESLDRLSSFWTPVLFDKKVVNRLLQLLAGVSELAQVFTGDSEKARLEARAEFFTLLKTWLSRAFAFAPSKAGALMQEILIADAKNGTVLLDAVGKLDRPFIYSLEKKARVVGEVVGLGSALSGEDYGKIQLPLVEANIVKQFSVEAEVPSALLRAVAFLVSNRDYAPGRLLDCLCWYPARLVCNVPVVEEAVFCWSWLIAARPDLELQFLSVMYDAWCWTVDQRKGLFHRSSSHPAEADGHRAWVGFLAEQLRTTTRPLDWSSFVSLMLLNGLLDPLNLNAHAASLGARFELLLLCTAMLYDGRVDDINAEGLLRERVFLAALGWFQAKPSWHEPATHALLSRDVNALVHFCRALTKEDTYFRGKFNAATFVAPTSTHDVVKPAAGPSISPAAEDESGTIKNKSMLLQSAQWKHLSVASATIRSSNPPSQSRHLLSPRGMSMMPDLNNSNNSPPPPQPLTASGSGSVPPSSSRNKSPKPNGKTDVATTTPGAQEAIAYFNSIDHRRQLILLLVGNELARISAWNNPYNRQKKQVTGANEFSSRELGKKFSLEFMVEVAWSVNPEIAVHMRSRFPIPEVEAVLRRLVLAKTQEVTHIPEAVKYLLTEENVQQDIPQLKWLLYWTKCNARDALRVLLGRFGGHPFVTHWAGTVLESLGTRKVLFYLPQLVQGLRWDKSGLLMDYLANACRTSILICHQTLWCTSAYTDISDSSTEADREFVNKVVQLQHRIKAEMSDVARKKWLQESGFFESVTSISGILQPMLGQDAKIRKTLVAELTKIQPQGHLYLPTNPDTRVLGIDVSSAAPMKSHAKVPILVNFVVKTELYEENHGQVDENVEQVEVNPTGSRTQACIFKVGDDVRQDMMALQIIEFCKKIFDAQHLDVFLFPYKVIATHPNEGIIEVVPNSQSRDQLGKKSDGNLYKWFRTKYGAENSPAFQRARDCFIRSLAAYSVVSYILQVKDRHNGNILVDNDGHVVHIDFGFLFDISPGGNLKFERSPFKLTQEMVDILGGTLETEQFGLMLELATKSFLCIREHMDEILVLVELMLGTGFACFKENTMENLRQRFQPELDVAAAAEYFTTRVVFKSFGKFSTLTTWFYDAYQAFENKIDY